MKRTTTTFLSSKKLQLFVVGFATIGAITLLATKAAAPMISIEPENGTLASGAQVLADTTASGGKAVLFKAPVITYCGGRTFTAPAHCIGAAEWATHTCTTYAQCQTAGFTCYAYMNTDTTKIYNLSSFGNSHSAGPDPIINPAVCGQDFYNVMRGAVPDFDNGTVPQNSKHVAVQNRTQAAINATVTGNEYDPSKP